jgi:hypothetical protein
MTAVGQTLYTHMPRTDSRPPIETRLARAVS